MPMEETLKEWCGIYHNNDDFLRMFLVMDKTMKYIHSSGYYVTNFNPKNIVVSINSNNGDYVIFKNLDVLDDDVAFKINSNIYNLAFLEVGLLSETLDNLRPEFLKDNFSQFKIFIPEQFVGYYQNILVNQGHIYLSDYVEIKNQQEVTKLAKSSEEDNGSFKGRSFVKATGHYNDVFDNKSTPIVMPSFDKKDNNIAAFVTNYALAFVIIASSLFIPIVAFILGQK